MLKKLSILFFSLIFSAPIYAESSVYTAFAKGDFDDIYQNVHDALEDNNLFVVFEPNIQKNISRFAERWGENYNRSKLSNIRSMIFCNGWYANEISNLDVQMTALCPLHITLTESDGTTSVNFVRPDFVAKGSKAESVAQDLTKLVIKAIDQGIEASKQ